MADEEKPTAVGRKPCGCCVAAFVMPDAGDPPEMFADYAKELRAWGREGMTIEMRTVGWVRHTDQKDGGLGICQHKRARGRRTDEHAQQGLFAGGSDAD